MPFWHFWPKFGLKRGQNGVFEPVFDPLFSCFWRVFTHLSYLGGIYGLLGHSNDHLLSGSGRCQKMMIFWPKKCYFWRPKWTLFLDHFSRNTLFWPIYPNNPSNINDGSQKHEISWKKPWLVFVYFGCFFFEPLFGTFWHCLTMPLDPQ